MLEYTTTKSEGISKHIKTKSLLYDAILDNQEEFLNFLDSSFPDFKSTLEAKYDRENCKVAIVYCSKNTIDSSIKDAVTNVKYFDYNIVRYFKSVTEAVKLSAIPEIISFLGFEYQDVGLHSSGSGESKFSGSVLPHTSSNYEKGYKVVSFYVDPKTLLEQSYVLRRDGWRDDEGVYQRMISKGKIKQVRKYLNDQKRVFINNIIVTLPSTTQLVNEKGQTLDPDKLTKTSPGIIQIPQGYGTIGLIDGQHRVFAYHEGGVNDTTISTLREKQNLLVTGIIYPPSVKDEEKTKFEAKIFLEINSTQTKAKSQVTHAIKLLLEPFAPESIAKAVLNRLNDTGPLTGEFERYFFDADKIKSTSVVSYGIKPLVKLSGDDSLFKVWDHADKDKLLKGKDAALLQQYINYCATEINMLMGGVKANTANIGLWTNDKNIKGRILNTTSINGLIVCLRELIADKGKTLSFETYKKKFSGLKASNFQNYKSSQYGALGKALYKAYFS